MRPWNVGLGPRKGEKPDNATKRTPERVEIPLTDGGGEGGTRDEP